MAVRTSRTRLHLAAALGALALALALVSCSGVPTPGERAARAGQAQVAERFRPGDHPPTLPALSEDSILDEFLTYAVLRHPKVEAAYYDWVASVDRITIARGLPDPVFTVGIDVQKGLEDDVTSLVTTLIGGLMTDLPGPGKLKTRADLQTEESKAAFARFQFAATETALGARNAYYELFLVEERLAVTEKNLAYVRDMGESVRRRSEAGLADLQDVLQVESDAARLENDAANFKDQRAALVAAWKSALGVPPSEADPPTPRAYTFTGEDAVSSATLAAVLENNPRLRVLQADIKRAEAAIAVAYKSRVPDFTLGLEAEAPTAAGTANPRDTVWRPRVGVTVPIWRDRIAAEIAEAQAMKQAANAELGAEQLALARDYALNVFGIQEATRNLATLRDVLLPRQRQIVELSERSYQAGRISFFELIEQQRRLLDLELTEAEGRAEREKLIGELNLALTGTLPVGLAAPRTGAEK